MDLKNKFVFLTLTLAAAPLLAATLKLTSTSTVSLPSQAEHSISSISTEVDFSPYLPAWESQPPSHLSATTQNSSSAQLFYQRASEQI